MEIKCARCGATGDVIATQNDTGNRVSIRASSDFLLRCKATSDELVNDPAVDEFDCPHFLRAVEEAGR